MYCRCPTGAAIKHLHRCGPASAAAIRGGSTGLLSSSRFGIRRTQGHRHQLRVPADRAFPPDAVHLRSRTAHWHDSLVFRNVAACWAGSCRGHRRAGVGTAVNVRRAVSGTVLGVRAFRCPRDGRAVCQTPPRNRSRVWDRARPSGTQACGSGVGAVSTPPAADQRKGRPFAATPSARQPLRQRTRVTDGTPAASTEAGARPRAHAAAATRTPRTPGQPRSVPAKTCS